MSQEGEMNKIELWAMCAFVFGIWFFLHTAGL
jgi:hypothetical protein